MGHIETTAKRARTKRNIRKAVLAAVAVAGVLSVAALAPNAMQIIETMSGGKKKKTRKFAVEDSFHRLLDGNYLEFEKTEAGRKNVRLTDKGKLLLIKIGEGQFGIKTPWRWDKRWRIVMFDIPEDRRPVRVKLWRTLRQLGFYHLQDSAWTYPYECEDLIKLVKTDLRIGLNVIYIIAESIEGDAAIRKFFGLK